MESTGQTSGGIAPSSSLTSIDHLWQSSITIISLVSQSTFVKDTIRNVRQLLHCYTVQSAWHCLNSSMYVCIREDGNGLIIQKASLLLRRRGQGRNSSWIEEWGWSFLNIGAITPLGTAPAGFAQQCPRCDNSSLNLRLAFWMGLMGFWAKLWMEWSG